MLDRRFLSIRLAVLAIANAPDDNIVNGSQYIVGANPEGAFSGAPTNSIASYDGSVWKFSPPRADLLEVLNLQTLELLSFNGSAWTPIASLRSSITPVLAVIPSGNTLPASANAGEAFLNTDDAKIYTATETDTWDEGTITSNGSRYASSSDFNIYTSNGAELTPYSLLEGDVFLNKEDNCLYVYNGSAFSKVGGSSEVLNSIVTEKHTLSSDEVSAKAFSLNNNIAQGFEDKTLLFVSGIAQSVGTDFSASGSTISWENKQLDNINLIEGDVFIILYVKE